MGAQSDLRQTNMGISGVVFKMFNNKIWQRKRQLWWHLLEPSVWASCACKAGGEILDEHQLAGAARSSHGPAGARGLILEQYLEKQEWPEARGKVAEYEDLGPRENLPEG